MKRIISAAFAGAAIFLVFSCKGIDPAKKYPNMVADADPVSAGTIEAAFDRMFSSKPSKFDGEVIFYPRLNAVALEFRYETVNYRQFWDETARRQFATALERYKADYESRKLIDRYRRTRAVYGKVTGRVEWETFRLTRTRIAHPTIEIGYRFRDNSPFFSTLMRSAKEVDAPGGENITESQQINLYFTRAQADDLVKLFDQSYLMGLLRETGNINAGGSVVVDNY